MNSRLACLSSGKKPYGTKSNSFFFGSRDRVYYFLHMQIYLDEYLILMNFSRFAINISSESYLLFKIFISLHLFKF